MNIISKKIAKNGNVTIKAEVWQPKSKEYRKKYYDFIETVLVGILDSFDTKITINQPKSIVTVKIISEMMEDIIEDYGDVDCYMDSVAELLTDNFSETFDEYFEEYVEDETEGSRMPWISVSGDEIYFQYIALDQPNMQEPARKMLVEEMESRCDHWFSIHEDGISIENSLYFEYGSIEGLLDYLCDTYLNSSAFLLYYNVSESFEDIYLDAENWENGFEAVSSYIDALKEVGFTDTPKQIEDSFVSYDGSPYADFISLEDIEKAIMLKVLDGTLLEETA